jgi:hypothetical protein
MPFWKEPIESMVNTDVREVVILKPSRAGFSENVLLNLIRYHVACDPIPILYLGAQQESTERFHKERITLGLKLSESTERKLSQSNQAGTIITMPDCSIVSTYPGSRSAAKQFGYGLVLGDEVSTWPAYAADMLRKRTDTYRFAHIVLGSSPDPQQKRPSSEDPIFQEFESGDKRYRMMADPKTGSLFKFEMGSRETVYGLKWDQTARRDDGSWDLKRVKESAHYITPDGTRIDTEEKRGIVASGQWVPTNTDKATVGKRSYFVNSFYLPFRNGDFGEIAVAFLEANRKGPEALRVFIYEYLAEQFYGSKQEITTDFVIDRQAKYQRKTRPSEHADYKQFYIGKKLMVFCTVDVQKATQWYGLREHVEGGDSGLIEYAEVAEWEKIKERSIKYGCAKTLIDNSYEERRHEVFDQCISGVMRGAVPCFGRDSLVMPYEAKKKDPFEGTPRHGRHGKLWMITFNPDQIKHVLLRLVTGQHQRLWRVYENIDADYVRQMTAEECIDGSFRKKHNRNHLWDIEVLQLLASKVFGLFTDNIIDMTPPKPQVVQDEKPKREKQELDPRVMLPKQREDDADWHEDEDW